MRDAAGNNADKKYAEVESFAHKEISQAKNHRQKIQAASAIHPDREAES
jgi:hypothetical protein